MTRLALCALSLVIALSLAACGGDDDGGGGRLSKSEYETEMAKIQKTLENSLQGVQEDIQQSKSLDQIGDGLDDLAAEIDKAADQAGELEPPEDIDSEHQDLVDGIKQFADEFREAGDVARDGDEKKIQSTLSGIQQTPGAKKAEEASDAIEKKGYDIDEDE
jgi:hypothetical protein